MRPQCNTPYDFRQRILLRNTSNASMTSPTKDKQPLSERSSNIPSPTKSPSKIPLPPSPEKSMAPHQSYFSDETGSMDAMFRASTLSQKPELVRKISEAHNAGQTYVSPSDNILSPTTKKLSEVKGKRFR